MIEENIFKKVRTLVEITKAKKICIDANLRCYSHIKPAYDEPYFWCFTTNTLSSFSFTIGTPFSLTLSRQPHVCRKSQRLFASCNCRFDCMPSFALLKRWLLFLATVFDGGICTPNVCRRNSHRRLRSPVACQLLLQTNARRLRPRLRRWQLRWPAITSSTPPVSSPRLREMNQTFQENGEVCDGELQGSGERKVFNVEYRK